jgi:hypothetical protein
MTMEFDFDKNGQVADLNTVPEVYRGVYVESEGADGSKVYKVSDSVRGIVEAYSGTARALSKARTDLKAANDESAGRRVTKKAVMDFAKELGVEDVSEDEPLSSLKGHIEELVKKVKGGKDIQINLDKIKADHDKRVAEVSAQSQEQVVKMQGALERYLVDQAATAALAEMKGSIQLLLPHVKAHTKVVQDGEEYVVRVVDAQGDFRSNGKGGFMTVKDLVAEMKTLDTFGRAFDSETAGGTGSPPGVMHQRRPGNEAEPKSSTDKIAAGLSKGNYSRNR